MNRYTVGKASLGLAIYLKKAFPDAGKRGVVIACDTRNNSTLFAKCAADVFTAEGIPTRLFSFPVPTPVLSFAVRHFGACAGVVVTASHNPSAYNGYKAYDETGCQLGPEAADTVFEVMQSVTNETLANQEVKFADKSACCVIMASKGYPEKYENGFEIVIPENIADSVYVAGAKLSEGKLLSAGGRVLGVTAIADDLKGAIDNAYAKVKTIKFDNAFYRSDIGQRALKATEEK
jgi:phosphomannomutase